MTRPHPQRIVIVGSGIAGWMAAAALASALPRTLHQVNVVDTAEPDEDLSLFGPVEASLPSLGLFHAMLGLDEDVVLCRTGGSFSLGTAYSGWSSEAQTYFAPFGDFGAPLDNVPFHMLAARLRANGQRVRLGDYCFAALLAQLGRFARPADDPRSVLSTLAYGLHLPLHPYRKLMIEVAKKQGASHARGVLREVRLGSAGDIAAILLDSSEQVEGDLFIDCTGTHGLLMSQALGTPFESWREWLPLDRVLSSRCDSELPPSPYSHAGAEGIGWRRTVPAQGSIGECLFYSSELLTQSDAERRFLAGLVAPASADLRDHAFKSGRLSEIWQRNCIALGTAAAMIEPLQPSSLHLIQSGIERLLRLFPQAGSKGAERSEYNRQMGEELERLRDFAIARYVTNGRNSEPLWDRLRTMSLPPTLADKIELFCSRGRVPLYDEEVFEEPEWVALLDSQGIRPRRYDARADAIAGESLARHLARLREVMIAAAASLPSHSDYIARHCATLHRAGQ